MLMFDLIVIEKYIWI